MNLNLALGLEVGEDLETLVTLALIAQVSHHLQLVLQVLAALEESDSKSLLGLDLLAI